MQVHTGASTVTANTSFRQKDNSIIIINTQIFQYHDLGTSQNFQKTAYKCIQTHLQFLRIQISLRMEKSSL